jgi:hypothetical protein
MPNAFGTDRVRESFIRSEELSLNVYYCVTRQCLSRTVKVGYLVIRGDFVWGELGTPKKIPGGLQPNVYLEVSHLV